MDEKKSVGRDVAAWIVGFVIGLIVPAAACLAVAIFWFKKPGDEIFNLRAGFFGCLLCATALFSLGVRGWRRWPFSRGLTVGAGLWLAGLPFVAGDCTQSGPP